MLTIQPNLTNQSLRRVPAFKAGDISPDDKLFKDKTDYYEGQKKEFENLANNDMTPKPLKNIAKAFKVISEILFEGWAVAWGAAKGAKFVKSSVVSGVESSFAKETKNILKPIGKGFILAGKKLAQVTDSAVKYVKETSTFAKLNKGLSTIAEKMNNNKYGKFALNVLKKIGQGIKVVADYTAKPFKKLAANMKNTSFDAAYDKTAKATSTTLGVGAGAACAYNEIMHPENAKIDNESGANNETLKEIDEEEVDE